MKALLLDAGRPESCQPVTCGRSLGEVPIANRLLADWQRAALSAAGWGLEGSGGSGTACLVVRGEAWLSEPLLVRLREADPPARVMAVDGSLLAWLGLPDRAPESGKVIAADDESLAIRYPWDLLRINELVVGSMTRDDVRGTVSPRAEVHGRLTLGEGSEIRAGVYVEGNVVIGRHCRIGPNCYLRGALSIGDGCHIGQAVEIKNSLLMDHVNMGHLSYCGDSIIGARVNFGAGTITANLRHDGQPVRSVVEGRLVGTGRRKMGVIIGDDVHTGIHTSLYPGRKMWPGTWTRPGAIVREDVPAGGV